MEPRASTIGDRARAYARPIVVALVLAALVAAGFWGYRGQQKRTLDRTVITLVQDSTNRLRDALALLGAGPEATGRLDAAYRALAANIEKLHGSVAAPNPSLVWAADGYIGEVHALVRRQIEAHRSRDAVQSDIREIREHMRSAAGRSSVWIQRALELKKRLESDFFDFRLASGGLEKSLRALPGARRDLEPLVARDALIDTQTLSDATSRSLAVAKKLAEEVVQTRDLPEARS